MTIAESVPKNEPNQTIETKLLGGHLKTGHMWTLQNRPTEWKSGQEYL